MFRKETGLDVIILVCGKLRMFMFKDAGNTSNCNSSLQQCRWAFALLNSWFTMLPTMVLKILRIHHVFPHSYASEKNNLAKKFVFCMDLFRGVNANVQWRRWWWLHPPRTARSSGKYLILRWMLLICWRECAFFCITKSAAELKLKITIPLWMYRIRIRM